MSQEWLRRVRLLKKLVLVYNPQASHYLAVETEVLSVVRNLTDWLVGKYEVGAGGVCENAKRLSEILSDGDLVIVAGGDGTATMAVNGVMLSGKDVTLGVLGYGNFNDTARMLRMKRPVEYGGEYIGGVLEILQKFEEGKIREIYPLEVRVNGEHWRYAPCYFSMGMLAESTMVFEEPKVREKLKSGKKRLCFSMWALAKWYFRNRKRSFLSDGKVMPRDVCIEVAMDEELESGERKEEDSKEEGNKEIKFLQKEERKEVRREHRLGRKERRRELQREVIGPKLLEMKVKTQAGFVMAGKQVKVGLLNAGIKTRELCVGVKGGFKKGGEKEDHALGPEIIIHGADEIEKRRGKSGDVKEDGNEKPKAVECAVEAEKGRELGNGVTDYIAVNSPRVAHIMKGGRYYKKAGEFRSEVMSLGDFWHLLWFMMRSIMVKMPGKKTFGDVIRFDEPSEVVMQTEGEFEKLEGVKKVEVFKGRGIKVV